MTTPRDRAPTADSLAADLLSADRDARRRLAASRLAAEPRHGAATARVSAALAASGLTVTSELDVASLFAPSATAAALTRVEFTSPDGSGTGRVIVVSRPGDRDSSFVLVGRRVPSGYAVGPLASRGLGEPVLGGLSNAELLAAHALVVEDESVAADLSRESGRDRGDPLTWWLATSSREDLALALDLLGGDGPSEPPRRERGRVARVALLTAGGAAALVVAATARGGRSR